MAVISADGMYIIEKHEIRKLNIKNLIEISLLFRDKNVRVTKKFTSILRKALKNFLKMLPKPLPKKKWEYLLLVESGLAKGFMDSQTRLFTMIGKPRVYVWDGVCERKNGERIIVLTNHTLRVDGSFRRIIREVYENYKHEVVGQTLFDSGLGRGYVQFKDVLLVLDIRYYKPLLLLKNGEIRCIPVDVFVKNRPVPTNLYSLLFKMLDKKDLKDITFSDIERGFINLEKVTKDYAVESVYVHAVHQAERGKGDAARKLIQIVSKYNKAVGREARKRFLEYAVKEKLKI